MAALRRHHPRRHPAERALGQRPRCDRGGGDETRCPSRLRRWSTLHAARSRQPRSPGPPARRLHARQRDTLRHARVRLPHPAHRHGSRTRRDLAIDEPRPQRGTLGQFPADALALLRGEVEGHRRGPRLRPTRRWRADRGRLHSRRLARLGRGRDPAAREPEECRSRQRDRLHDPRGTRQGPAPAFRPDLALPLRRRRHLPPPLLGPGDPLGRRTEPAFGQRLRPHGDGPTQLHPERRHRSDREGPRSRATTRHRCGRGSRGVERRRTSPHPASQLSHRFLRTLRNEPEWPRCGRRIRTETGRRRSRRSPRRRARGTEGDLDRASRRDDPQPRRTRRTHRRPRLFEPRHNHDRRQAGRTRRPRQPRQQLRCPEGSSQGTPQYHVMG